MPLTQDQAYMRRALALAESTAGLASPNPQVGCVLVRDGEVLAEGAHRYTDRDHAEIVALKQAAATGKDVSGATAYVTLEPCSHHGRTGPCADALIAARIARCVVATADPNPLVSGRGLAKLRAAGMEVAVGIEQEPARALNEAFAWSIQHRRPFVTLKAALSTDGFLAPPPASRTVAEPHWLTGSLARTEVQRMRHASDAILTGIGTVLADDPLLTDRTGSSRRRPLLRVVLDSHLRIPLNSKLVRSLNEDLWIFCSEAAQREQPDKFYGLVSAGAIMTELPGSRPALASVLDALHTSEVRSVLLEAGSALNSAFLQHNLVDRATLFYSSTKLGPGAVPFSRQGPTPFQLEEQLSSVTRHIFGDDVCVSGLLHDPWAARTGAPALP